MRDLVVGFGRHVVIDHLALDVRRGEILGLVGASGGGKSVLMRTIIGLIPRQGGEIEVMGSPINHDRATRERGRAMGHPVSAGRAVLVADGAAEHPVSDARKSRALGRPDGRDRHRQARNGRAQPEDGDKFPSELSGGMTKRVALARALALDPAIVFLDEPTSGLDPIAAGDFDALIKTLQKTLGLTVFMVTHDLDSLNTVCDRVAALADGKIVAIGPMRELLQSEHPWVRAYFHGKRSQMLQPQSELRTWKPALPSSLSAPSCWRRSPPCSASSTGCTIPAGSARAPAITCSSRARCRGCWSAPPCCSTASGSAR